MPLSDRLDPPGFVTDGSGNKYSIPPDVREAYRTAFDERVIALLPDGRLVAIPPARRDELRLTDVEVAAVKAEAAEFDTTGFEFGLEDPGQFYNGVC